MRLQEIFDILAALGLVRSQVEFSQIWLGKSSRYYSSMLARQQVPGLGTFTALLFRLRNILAHTSDPEVRSAIGRLIQQLDDHVVRRAVSDGATRRSRVIPTGDICSGASREQFETANE